MAMQWLEKFIDNLANLLKEPPYLVFLFIGAVLVFVSILTNRYFEQVWLFFLYSIIGTIWRYIEKDVYKNVFTTDKQKAIVISIYHLGNIVLFFFLLNYLNLI
ncbi:hypothetical protein GW901_00315 [Candidatus Parcubacteria bacterium]|nr:hypothetical protein [Candidatus Parcubacteria bacterium]